MRTFDIAGKLALVTTALAALAALAAPVSARAAAAQPSPVALDAAGNGDAPLVVYAPGDAYTYVAWSAPNTQNNGNGIDLCILPPNASACEGGAAVLLTDPLLVGANALELAGLTVLPGSGEVVVLGSSTENGTGTYAWASPPGGGAFLTGAEGLQLGGAEISPVSLFYTEGSATALNGSDIGLFDNYAGHFSDSPFAGPKTPALLLGTLANSGSTHFRAESVQVAGSVLAAEPAPAPAAPGTDIVVGVGANWNSSQSTPSGCANYAASGFGVDIGTVGGTGSGSLNANGLARGGFGLLACSAEEPVLASGGTDGIGVLEQEGSGVSGAGSDWTLDYRPFDATSTGGSFGSAVLVQDDTSHVLDGADSLDVSDDAGTGVYASWLDEQGLVLDYSPNGGADWDPAVVLPALSTGASQRDPVIIGVGGGLAEIAYDNSLGAGDQVFVQSVELAPPEPTSLTTSQTSGMLTGADIAIPAGTTGESDQAALAGANASLASGTATYALYGTKSCSGTPVFTSPAAVAAGRIGPSSPVSASLAPGVYDWQVSYAGDPANDASRSACGAEKLTVTPPAMPSRTGSASGSAITLTITCAAPCTVKVTISVPAAGAARATGERRRKGRPKPKLVTIAKGHLRLAAAGKRRVTVRLTKAGAALVLADHGALKATVSLRTTVAGGTFTTSDTLKIRPKRRR
jgi:hypothetical protein